MTMKTYYRILTLAFIFFVAMSCGKKAETDSKEVAEEANEEKFDERDNEKTADFVVNAADAGMREVQLGQLAVSNAASPQVKQFAQTMVDDHAKVNEELKAAATTKNITVPAALSEKSQKVYNDLAEKTGVEFDKEYIDQMVKDHKDAVDLFKKQADDGKDPELAKWAAEKLPALQHHLEMAESAQETLKDQKSK
jgi:putative membrane protein